MHTAVSVVGCVRNRASNVRNWMESLSKQTIVQMMEIVLVDYSSTDGLQEVLDQSPVRLNVIRVNFSENPPGFPEAKLKNVGIRRATGDVVFATNVDVVYEPVFVERIVSRCGPGVLVQAVRKNARKGVSVTADARTIPEDSIKSMCNDYLLENGMPIVAGGDCQAMTRYNWNMFQGYDEDLYGWGGFDSDLTCRAILWGLTVEIVGHKHANYLHEWHDFNGNNQIEDAMRNHQIIMSKINSGTVARNDSNWGQG